jgi:hypothetical protein
MTGHSSAGEFGKIRWPDAELQSVDVDYDAVSLRIRESDGAIRKIRVEGHIGYSCIGIWDEVVIERAEFLETHSGLDACINSIRGRLGANWLDSGNEIRNSRHWFALVVHLSDGSVLEVFAARLRVER